MNGYGASSTCAVTYGATTVLVSRDESEPDRVYTERGWCIAKAIRLGNYSNLVELLRLSRFYAYKKTLGVWYDESIEKRLAEVFPS